MLQESDFLNYISLAEAVNEYAHFEAKMYVNKTELFETVESIQGDYHYGNLKTGGILFKERFAGSCACHSLVRATVIREKKKNTFPLTVITNDARCHPKSACNFYRNAFTLHSPWILALLDWVTAIFKQTNYINLTEKLNNLMQRINEINL